MWVGVVRRKMLVVLVENMKDYVLSGNNVMKRGDVKCILEVELWPNGQD